MEKEYDDIDNVDRDICGIEAHDLEAIRLLSKHKFNDDKNFDECVEIACKYIKNLEDAERAVERIESSYK